MIDFKNQLVNKDVYIECGVFLGLTIRQMSEHFNVCHGIELIEDTYNELCQQIESESQRRSVFRNIQIHLGNSIDVLPEIIDPNRSTTFYLDSHFTAANPSTLNVRRIAGTECPLLKELEIITSYDWSVPCMIIVDDWNMFTGEFWIKDRRRSKYCKHDWPTVEKIENILNNYEYITVGNRATFTHK